MKIEHKIILSNAFNLALILLIGLFALQNLNLVLTKLRFVEIADDLNASFLEMRLSEKNYFLYRDDTALAEIKDKLDRTMQSIETVRTDISRAIGEDNLERLKAHIRKYSETIDKVRREDSIDAAIEAKLRMDGKKLKEFSDTVTHLERTRVNDIILNSKNVLFYSFWAVFFFAILASHFLSQKILKSLRIIEGLAESISEGNFHTTGKVNSQDEIGSVIHAINSMSEELSNREEQIIQSKKLASIGILTAGVAHELTNPLNNISMIAQTYTELYDKLNGEQRIEFMNKVESETERIRDIIKNLLDFSKPKEANLKETEVNAVILKTLKLVQNMLDISNIEIKLNLEQNPLHVFIDEHQIQQVLVNLITNAVQAMRAGETIFISSKSVKARGSVLITVMDTGKGIPPEYVPHIFDPFFSTKGEGGTGLGLSVSYGIIKNHKGNIQVESKMGIGTTFTIELPAYKKAVMSGG